MPDRAAAQPEALRLRTGVYTGAMTGGDQVGWLGFDQPAFGGHLDVGYALLPFVTPELRVGGTVFPASDRAPGGAGGLMEVGIGASFEIEAPTFLRYGLFGHVNLAWTGALILPSVDVGLRAAIRVSESLAIGPEVSLGHVFWDGGEDGSTDAEFWSAGLSVTWQPFSPPPPGVVTRVETRESVVREEVPIDHYLIDQSPLPVTEHSGSLDDLLDASLPVTRREERTLIPPVLFIFDSTEMLPCGEVSLHAAREIIVQTDQTVHIEGYADGTGEDEYNADLSLRRAERVRDWLVSHGVDPARLEVRAHGERVPLEEETNDEFRQINRRVTFRVTELREAGDGVSTAPAVDLPIGVSCESPTSGVSESPIGDSSEAEAP